MKIHAAIFIIASLFLSSIAFASTPVAQQKSVQLSQQEQAGIDKTLRTLWDDMRTALGKGQINKSLKFFSPKTRDSYRTAFESLTSDQRKFLADGLKDIKAVSINAGTADYLLSLKQEGRVDKVALRFENENGEWLIESF